MSLTELLQEYGYAAVLIGTFLEGETILVMAGFAAHRGYLSLPGVVLAAFCGSLLGDQLAFFLGRRYGARALSRFPRVASGVDRATSLLERRGDVLLVGFRFVYGIRNATPLAAGMSKLPFARFFVLNAIGAALWAVVVALGGYVFGHGIEIALENARRAEEAILLALLCGGAAVACFHFVRSKRKRGA
jgi:membrane protein DedA with SNARE-associated domain